ncbi:AP-2 complex subunit alpha [Smittium culicis]|uniref:AP-2 complex subunit alpha n=1 Tax=Smittium culicis TaxID=133412 RepID=A0A1R1XH26_9FUNG|nr:AP-2 complex subunit alpha [Smittium culicis]OMJ13906.1 AP-2 complex subunit alpha [Smittium culicis]
MSMRGLNTFISDLRKYRNLNGYNKKKYVSKLLFMVLAGYKIDFGYLEIVQLINSPKYSEKRIVLGFLHILFTIKYFLSNPSPPPPSLVDNIRVT